MSLLNISYFTVSLLKNIDFDVIIAMAEDEVLCIDFCV